MFAAIRRASSKWIRRNRIALLAQEAEGGRLIE
jgi:hypothetical protein